MSRVITFSRKFPSTHPRKREDTHFVEQIWNGLNKLNLPVPKNSEFPNDFMWSILPLSNFGEKYHTMRSGNRWKVGDKFSPRVWSGAPYQSKQIIIADDIEIKKLWDVEVHSKMKYDDKLFRVLINGKELVTKEQYALLAKNDGLSEVDLLDWFWNPKKPFVGQIICWSENINY